MRAASSRSAPSQSLMTQCRCPVAGGRRASRALAKVGDGDGNAGVRRSGAMGSRLARRLLAAGHTVVGYNRTPEKARDLVTAGLRFEKTPGAVAASTEAVFSMG